MIDTDLQIYQNVWLPANSKHIAYTEDTKVYFYRSSASSLEQLIERKGNVSVLEERCAVQEQSLRFTCTNLFNK